MTSSINYASINENFPLAGQDNDTQVFRENFTTIKGNFQAAYTEINTLQTRTAGLITTEVAPDLPSYPGGVNFGGRVITNAVLFDNVGKVKNGGVSNSGNVELTFSGGEYQHFTLTGAVTFNFAGSALPTTGFKKMTLELKSDGTGRTVTFTMSGAGGVVIKKNNFPGTLTVTSSTDPIIIDAWYRPGGGIVFLEYKGVFA
jgi:hypothetical protein